MGAGLWVATVVPLLAFLGTVLTILAARRQDKASATKTSADALEVIQATTLNLLDPMQRQIDQLRAENTYLTADLGQIKERVGIVEGDRDVLAAAVRLHAEWEDAGRPDPPGPPRAITDRVRQVLSRLHDAA